MTSKASLKSIVIIVDYFGTWPEWFPLFLASCRMNPTVHWHIHTDCTIPPEHPPNVEFYPMTFAEYKQRVGESLGISLGEIDPYKICELRTANGVIYKEEIRDYDYFGYGDLDVIYGDIRHLYNSQVLSYDVISSHEWCTSGHLLLIRNTPKLCVAFEHVKNWREVFESPKCHRFDEDIFRWVFRSADQLGVGVTLPSDSSLDDVRAQRIINASGLPSSGVIDFDPYLKTNNYFKEQYSTPLTPFRWLDGGHDHPEVWFWKDGKVTNSKDGTREFLYLHLMNFLKAKALSSRYSSAPWDESKIMHIDVECMVQCGVRIDFQGIHSLNTA